MLVRSKSPAENRLPCDTVWVFFKFFSYKLIQTRGSFFLLSSIGFTLMLLWYELLYLWVISLRKWVYLLLLFFVNDLNIIPLIVRLKRSPILAFSLWECCKKLNLILFKKFLYMWIQKLCSFISLYHYRSSLCSNNSVSPPLISLPCFDFRGKNQPYLDSTSIFRQDELMTIIFSS